MFLLRGPQTVFVAAIGCIFCGSLYSRNPTRLYNVQIIFVNTGCKFCYDGTQSINKINSTPQMQTEVRRIIIHKYYPVLKMALRANMGSIVLKSLSVLLGIFFIFVGVMKITSQVSKDLHKDLVRISVHLMSCIMVYSTIKLYSIWMCCIPLAHL